MNNGNESLPLVSVIVPLYQQEERLYGALQSIQAQTYPNFEAIIIDDCSSDDSYISAKKQLADDSRFTVLCHKKRSGLWITRKNGILHAKGEYILFVDPRETLEPDTVSTLVDAIITSGADMVQMRSNVSNSGSNTRFAEAYGIPFGVTVSGNEFISLTNTIGNSTVISPFCGDKLYRTDLLREAISIDFKGTWGEVQILNIQYLRSARSIYFLDYFGVNANWADDASNYKVSRLTDYKNLYCIKQVLGQDQAFIHDELYDSLHYYASQLLGELAWTGEAAEFFLAKELSDPFWHKAGIDIEASELVEMHTPVQSRNPFKILIKGIMRR